MTNTREPTPFERLHTKPCPQCDLKKLVRKTFIETSNCEAGCCPSGVTIWQCTYCKEIEVD